MFDAFANLPGMEPAALLAALQPPAGSQPAQGALPATAAAEMRLIWRRKGPGVVAAR